MKLPDNLKRIRKENNLSQEQLAEKLGVSRQAVSKWESGQSYPEMDKVLMICKLFNYNIDELMNENVKEVSENKQSKINFNKYVDDFFAYVTKTIRMFESMKFTQKVKCIIEQLIIGFCLFIVLSIIMGVLGSVFSGIFNWIPSKTYTSIVRILESLYLIFGLVVGIVILLHIFKIRYLDYYEIVEEKEEPVEKEIVKNENNKEIQSTQKVLLEKNREKIIIRDPVHSESRFLNGILKIIIFGIKAFVAFCSIGFMFSLIGLCIGLICSFLFVKSGFIFLGALICILAGIAGNIVILEMLYNFVVSRKNSKTRMGITFLAALIALGIGIGVVIIGFTKFDFVSDVNKDELQKKTITFEMEDDISIQAYGDIDYVVTDNSNLQIELEYYDIYEAYARKSKNNCIFIECHSAENNIFKNIRLVIDDINNRQIRDYDYFKVRVYTTQENIDKIKNNINYERYTLKDQYEDMIDNLNDTIEQKEDKIDEKQEEIEELKDKITYLESLLQIQE